MTASTCSRLLVAHSQVPDKPLYFRLPHFSARSWRARGSGKNEISTFKASSVRWVGICRIRWISRLKHRTAHGITNKAPSIPYIVFRSRVYRHARGISGLSVPRLCWRYDIAIWPDSSIPPGPGINCFAIVVCICVQYFGSAISDQFAALALEIASRTPATDRVTAEARAAADTTESCRSRDECLATR